jgi:hypothetical protein
MGLFTRTFAAVLVAVSALPALAGTIKVTSGADDVNSPPAGGIREAIANAQPGDTIVIASGVKIELAGDLEIPAGKGLAIEGKVIGGVKNEVKITQADPAPSPPAKVVVKATGTTLKQLNFDGVEVRVQDTSDVTITSCDFDGKGKQPGVQVLDSTGVNIGAPNGFNYFKNCTEGVSSQNSTDVKVTDNQFSNNGQAVNSRDDTNITVKDNTVVGSSGIAVSGSSGTIDRNKVTVTSTTGTGIGVSPSPFGVGSKGKITLTGNYIKLIYDGSVGIDVLGRTDVDLVGDKVKGKTDGVGIHLKPGPDALANQTMTLEDNNVSGPATAIVADFSDAPQGSLVLTGNVASKNLTGGILVNSGQFTEVTMNGNTVKGSGLAPDGSGFRLDGTGGPFRLAACAALQCGDGFFVNATNVQFDDVVAKYSRRIAFKVGGAAEAALETGTFVGNRQATIFIETGGDLGVEPQFAEQLFSKHGPKPPIDNAEIGWGSPQCSASFSGNGDLVINGPPGYLDPVVASVTDERGVSTSVDLVGGTGTISAANLPPGRSFVIRWLRAGSDGMDHQIGEGRIDRPKPPSGGTSHTFTVDKKKVTITTTIGASGSVTVSVTNNDDVAQTLEVSKFTGDWFTFPNGQVTFQAGQTRTIEIGHSSMKAVTETKKLILKFNGGIEAVVTCTGITK